MITDRKFTPFTDQVIWMTVKYSGVFQRSVVIWNLKERPDGVLELWNC